MKSRSKGKQGHHRDVSKEFMKKNLLNDLYPIPRHKFSVYSKNNHTQTVSKVRNILQFLDFTRSEEVALQMFREKIAVQLSFTRSSLDAVLKGVRAEGQVVNLANRLVFLKDDTQEKILFLLRSLVSTTYKDVRQLIELLFFYHFLQVNQREYRTLIREFQSKRIFEAIQAITSPSSQILTSKILSVIAMVYVKYGEDKRLSTIADKMLQLRRQVEQNYFEVKDLNVDRDYISTTFYLSLKCLQAISKEMGKECDILIKINRELQLLMSYYQRQMILEEAKDIIFAQMFKLKNEVSSKVEDNYFHSNIQESVVVLKKQRTQQALRQFRRRKSMSNLRHKSSLLYNSQDKNQENQVQYHASNSAEKTTKGFRQVYNMINPDKRFSKVSKNKGESGLKKSKKQATIEFARIKSPENDSKQSTQKEGTSSLFMKLGIFEYKYQKQKEVKKKEGQKQGRIEQIYRIFANQNKVLRDIPSKKLTSDLQHILRVEMGTKLAVKEMLKREIIDFSAGLAVARNHFNSFLVVRSCLEVEFLKIWIGQLYVCKVTLNLGGSQIKVEVVLNGKKNTIILHRGNNVLCERYLTIWPTIRYLIHKKLAQLSIFKRYEAELLTRKIAQGQLTRMCGDLYFQKFGHISKEQIEEINTCLDNAVKLVLVVEHYASRKASRYDLAKDYKFKIATTLTDGESIKLNMLAEVYLNEFPKIKLGSLIVCRMARFYLAELYSPREKLLTSINNKSFIQLEIVIHSLSSTNPVSGAKCSLQWTELERSRVFHHNFIRFFKLICSKVARSVDFTVRFTNFIAQRLQIKESPLFTGQSYFQTNKTQLHRNLYKKKNNKLSKAKEPLFLAERYKAQIIENQNYLQQPISFLPHHCYAAFHKGEQSFNKKKMRQLNPRIKSEMQWRQERKISGKSYLIIIRLKIRREKEFYADYTLVSRSNESKEFFRVNHLDIRLLTQPYYRQSQSSEPYEEQPLLLQKYSELALQLPGSFEFHYNHHIKKISVIGQNGLYRHSFKEVRSRKSSRIQRGDRQSPEFKSSLTKFEYGCRLRIAKVVKAGTRFAILTFKRNCLNGKYFWEIVLDYPRRYTQYVSQIDEEKLTYLLSDYHKSSSKQFLNKKRGMFLQQSSPPKLYNARPSCDSINISLNAKLEEFVDYKQKILGLFERDEVKIAIQGNCHHIQMRGEAFLMQQRVIEEWDYQKGKLYTTWIENKFLEVRVQSPKEEIEDSWQKEQDKQKPCIKGLESEVIGRIQLSYAFRFYEMENKQDDKEQVMLTKVCHFYLQWCIKKHQENYRL